MSQFIFIRILLHFKEYKKYGESMKYKAIALDLDGTLTDHNKKLPAENIKAVDKAIDMGIKVILASGRPLFWNNTYSR